MKTYRLFHVLNEVLKPHLIIFHFHYSDGLQFRCHLKNGQNIHILNTGRRLLFGFPCIKSSSIVCIIMEQFILGRIGGLVEALFKVREGYVMKQLSLVFVVS